MIGFISAISASLAIIILVVISSLVNYVQSIMPTHGLIKIDEFKYRYVMDGQYVDDSLLKSIVVDVESAGLANRVTSYQTGCSYGFNAQKRVVEEISTYNFLVLNQYFLDAITIDKTNNFQADDVVNTCHVDINLRPLIQ